MKENSTKPTRSENLNIRFEPRLRYLAGIAARQERRTLSNLIEAAVATHLDSVRIAGGGKQVALMDIAKELWSIHEAERFIALAERLPFLLTFEEEELFELIQQSKEYQSGDYAGVQNRFATLQEQAAKNAANKPTVSVGGFPYRGGRIDGSIPEAITQPKRKKATK
ncbi:MAG: hypothetical protein PW792_10225 [Acidobacteriaceae bacterium]|nr:hypothetical protein [Acidobacteriaceae bacterium]